MTPVKISRLFTVVSGDYHALKELDPGGVPLISCGDTDNGVVGYFDIPKDKQYEQTVTVAYNGSWPIMAKFHPYSFGAKDDVAVLLPIRSVERLTLFYVAALLNRMTWRYSYGRKCYREKLQDVELPIPTLVRENDLAIDEAAIARVFPNGIGRLAKAIACDAGDWAATDPASRPGADALNRAALVPAK